MNVDERIELLAATGTAIKADIKGSRLDDLLADVENENPWFIKQFVIEALENLVDNFLNREKLVQWSKAYDIKDILETKIIGVVTAGNLPLVGIHDIISVLISGNHVSLKLSKKDSVLTKYFIQTLKEIKPDIEKLIYVSEQLKRFDAVIATGSNNTNRYFEQYFGKYPHLLRKNRTSIAIIRKNESEKELKELAKDIYSYFGLGCRSVSKVFIEDGFEIRRLLDVCQEYAWLGNHYKFHNNYTYQKSIYLVNKVSHFDTGFSIFKEDNDLHSPISVTFFENYSSLSSLLEKINGLDDQIQIIVSGRELSEQKRVVGFGISQKTELFDYADGKDTLKFLSEL
ncbi:MAG: acyl-CoA reductase [Bacteroidia bacterium]